MVELSKDAAERMRRATIKVEQAADNPLPPKNRNRFNAPSAIIAKLTKNLEGGFWEATQQAWNGGSFGDAGSRTWSAAADGGRLYELNGNENIEVGTIVVVFFIGATDGGFQWVFDFPGVEATTGGWTGKFPEMTAKPYNPGGGVIEYTCIPGMHWSNGILMRVGDPVILTAVTTPGSPDPIEDNTGTPVAENSDNTFLDCLKVCLTLAGDTDFNGTYQRVTGCRWINNDNPNFEIIRDGTQHFMWDTRRRAPDDYVYESNTFSVGTCPCPSDLTWTVRAGFNEFSPAPTVVDGDCNVCGGEFVEWLLNEAPVATTVADTLGSTTGTINGATLGGGQASFDGVNDNIVATTFCAAVVGDFRCVINMNFASTNADEARLFAVGKINVRWDAPEVTLKLNGGNGGVSSGDKNQRSSLDHSDTDIRIVMLRIGTKLTISINGSLEWDEVVTTPNIDEIFLCSQFNSTEFCDATVKDITITPAT